jgi:hypothetical protein
VLVNTRLTEHGGDVPYYVFLVTFFPPVPYLEQKFGLRVETYRVVDKKVTGFD